jgi:hypothetical protein
MSDRTAGDRGRRAPGAAHGPEMELKTGADAGGDDVLRFLGVDFPPWAGAARKGLKPRP